MCTASTTSEPPPSAADKSGGSGGHLTVNHRRIPSVHGPRDRRESAAWYEEDTEDGWRVAYRLLAQGDVVVIAEVRIFPADPARRGTLGEWSMESAAVPPGGMTDAAVKALRVELPVERAREAFADLTRGRSREMASLDFIQPLGQDRNGTRPRRRDPLPLLKLAAAYVRLVEARHRAPVRAAAIECGYTRGYASKRLADARECGYLTPTSRGKAGGVLTPLACRLLATATRQSCGRGARLSPGATPYQR